MVLSLPLKAQVLFQHASQLFELVAAILSEELSLKMRLSQLELTSLLKLLTLLVPIAAISKVSAFVSLKVTAEVMEEDFMLLKKL